MDDERTTEQTVRWRSRRGMLELDHFLVPFAAEAFAALAPPLRRSYAALLDCDDWVILDWLQDRSPPEDGFVEIVAAIRAFNDSRGGR